LIVKTKVQSFVTFWQLKYISHTIPFFRLSTKSEKRNEYQGNAALKVKTDRWIDVKAARSTE